MVAYALASMAITVLVGCVLLFVFSVKNAPVCDEDEADKVFRKVQRKLAAEEDAAASKRDREQGRRKRAA